MKNVIFCYSGTGNCLDLAKNIARQLGEADIVMIRKKPTITDVRSASCVGFVFPCHGGGVPKDVLEYAKLLQISPDSYTFAVSQSSSYAGVGLNDLNRIVPLDYWTTTRHHCSCVWLFPHGMMLPPVSVKRAQKRQNRAASKIAADILSRKSKDKKPPRNVLNLVENKAWPLIVKGKAKKFKVSDNCIACGTCAQLCPRENIQIINGKAQIGTNCIQCLSCLQYCPQNAISLGKITDKREHYHNPNVTAEELRRDVIRVG